MNKNAALVAHNLSKSYNGKAAVDDVSLTLSAGSVTAFLGANGAGKTTALRLLLGLLTPDTGHTLYGGRPLHTWRAPARAVGAVMGGVAGHPKHTLRDHLRMVAAGVGADDEVVGAVLERVGLTAAAGRRLGKLSLGMGQRAGIAQALIGDPAVLVLDEPVNGLDPHSIHWLRTLLRQLADDGKAVLLATHLLAEAEQLADHVTVLAQGRVVAQATAAELGDRATGHVIVQGPDLDRLLPLVRRHDAVLESTGPGTARVSGIDRFRIGDYAAEQGIPLHWLEERRPSLEEFYLSVAQQEFAAR
ncbi:ABC transporter ATP-binding protein [Streptomyces paromomycinus]|uniref:Putative ABC transporter, ATP-binding protein n=1 Tax=Streptomyces paromomycinus TaxID=92743 RepID=A0A401WBM0_STREY|nr:ABC transporter ATP-binding protein [Streptomyces paromomycinus]GCD46701.1 putative ABC transporter, ATP-binding protein [Streptomyces paromomycinus]